jgi:hypothetical protein
MIDIVRCRHGMLVGAAWLCCTTFLCSLSMAFAEEPAPPATADTSHEEIGPTAEGVDNQGRGGLPGLVEPNATVHVTAPTASLATVRNAIQVTSKSVSVNLRIAPNLPVTVPVEISVAYISPAQTQRQTKTYNPAIGLTLLYHEAEGDGKPRSMHLDITVRELVPNGQSFSSGKDLTIIPLYDVSLSQLRFAMLSACDLHGKNDITLRWDSPDGRRREAKFVVAKHGEKVIRQFSWGHRGVSAQSTLVEPSMQFVERDPIPDLGFNPLRRSSTPLVPGPKKQVFNFVLDEKASGPFDQTTVIAGCQARIKYRIDRKVMTFDRF